MGCGASKDSLKRVVPTDERSTNPAAAKSSNTPSAYSSTITPELDIIKILTESDLDPLKLKEKKDGEDEAAGTADSAWKLAISFKIICLPNQLIQAIKIIGKKNPKYSI